MHRLSDLHDRPLTFIIDGRHVVAPLLSGASADEVAALRFPVPASAFVSSALWKGEPVHIFPLRLYLHDPVAWWRSSTPELREAETRRKAAQQMVFDADVASGVANLASHTAKRAQAAAEADLRRAKAIKADIGAIVAALEAARTGAALCPCCRTLILDHAHIDRQLPPVRALARAANAEYEQRLQEARACRKGRIDADCLADEADLRRACAEAALDSARATLAEVRSGLERRSLSDALDFASRLLGAGLVVVDARGADADLDSIRYPCIVDSASTKGA